MFKPAERRYCPCLDTSQVEEINEEIKYPNLQNFLPLNVSWGKFQEKKLPINLKDGPRGNWQNTVLVMCSLIQF